MNHKTEIQLWSNQVHENAVYLACITKPLEQFLEEL